MNSPDTPAARRSDARSAEILRGGLAQVADDVAAALTTMFGPALESLASRTDADAGAADPTAKPEARGHAHGKDKVTHELHKHLKRLAKIERLEELAKASDNEKLISKLQLLRDKELKRHQRVLARVDIKETSKDAAAAAAESK